MPGATEMTIYFDDELPSFFEEEKMLEEMAEACQPKGHAVDRRQPGELDGFWGNR